MLENTTNELFEWGAKKLRKISGWLYFKSRGYNPYDELFKDDLTGVENRLGSSILFQYLLQDVFTDVIKNIDKKKYKKDENLEDLLLKGETILANKRKQRASYDQYTLIVLDLDELKLINDEYGHEMGDIKLQTVSSTIDKLLKRKHDHINKTQKSSHDNSSKSQENKVEGSNLGRYGGDEFIIQLSGANTKYALNVLETVRSHTKESNIQLIQKIIEEKKKLLDTSTDNYQKVLTSSFSAGITSVNLGLYLNEVIENYLKSSYTNHKSYFKSKEWRQHSRVIFAKLFSESDIALYVGKELGKGVDFPYSEEIRDIYHVKRRKLEKILSLIEKQSENWIPESERDIYHSFYLSAYNQKNPKSPLDELPEDELDRIEAAHDRTNSSKTKKIESLLKLEKNYDKILDHMKKRNYDKALVELGTAMDSVYSNLKNRLDIIYGKENTDLLLSDSGIQY